MQLSIQLLDETLRALIPDVVLPPVKLVEVSANPRYAGKVCIQFTGELSTDARRKAQQWVRGRGAALADSIYVDADMLPEAIVNGASKGTETPVIEDPRDAQIKALQDEKARLSQQLADALQQGQRTFPVEAGTKYFVAEISTEDQRESAAERFDRLAADFVTITEELKAVGTERPTFWHVARLKRKSASPTESAQAAVPTGAGVPSTPQGEEAPLIQSAVPVLTTLNALNQLFETHPLLRAIREHGAQEVKAIMNDANSQRVHENHPRPAPIARPQLLETNR